MKSQGMLSGLLVVVLSALQAGATLSSTTAIEVDRLQATFTNELAKYDKAHEEAISAVRDQYAVALVTLERKFTSAGSLDSVLAVKKEFTRFATDRSLRPGDLVAEPADLHALQQQYIKKFEALPAERAVKVVRLAELYGKSMRTLEENLTRQRLLEDAIAVKQLREGIPSLPAVAGASFVVSTAQPATSEVAVATPPTEPRPVPPVVAPQPPATNNVAVRSDKKVPKKYSGSSSSRIREQFDVFWKSIQRQNWEGAEAIVDPATVKAHGSQRVQGFIRGYGGRLAGSGENPNIRVELRSLDVDGDDRTANGSPRVWTGLDWQEMRPIRWIQTEGDWYIDVQATMAERRDNPRRDERRDERGGRPPR